MRRKEEYHLWQNSKSILSQSVRQSVSNSLPSDMGANPQSSIGTAFAFSRPNTESLILSNTSLLLEYTSKVFLASLQE